MFDLKNLKLTKSRYKLTEIGIRHIKIKKERENDVFSSILRKIGEDSKNFRNIFIVSLGNNCRNKFSQRLWLDSPFNIDLLSILPGDEL